MVQQRDFTIELVEAETKAPFKEHHHTNGQVYVEVEPDIEYFISVKKTGSSIPHAVKLEFWVDERPLKYSKGYTQEKICSAPTYCGIRHCVDSVSTHQSLKFVKPSIADDESNGSSRRSGILMGKVEIKIYQSTYQQCKGIKKLARDSTSTFEEPDPVSHSGNSKKRKKILRSEKGETTVSRGSCRTSGRFKKGSLIDIVTLNYCAAVGLIEAGVLPKPSDVYKHARMVAKWENPAKHRGDVEETPRRNPSTAAQQVTPETIDLLMLSSSDDDEEEGTSRKRKLFG